MAKSFLQHFQGFYVSQFGGVVGLRGNPVFQTLWRNPGIRLIFLEERCAFEWRFSAVLSWR